MIIKIIYIKRTVLDYSIKQIFSWHIIASSYRVGEYSRVMFPPHAPVSRRARAPSLRHTSLSSPYPHSLTNIPHLPYTTDRRAPMVVPISIITVIFRSPARWWHMPLKLIGSIISEIIFRLHPSQELLSAYSNRSALNLTSRRQGGTTERCRYIIHIRCLDWY